MPRYDNEQIAHARELDLLTYLQRYEPDELIHEGGGTYHTRSHDSLKISNGMWCWWSRGRIGGRSALDYLVTVRGMDFTEAVGRIVESSREPVPVSVPAQSRTIMKPFILPERNTDNRCAFAYLVHRGIDPEIINHCIKHGKIYEEKDHHNVVFVGFDGDIPRYATMRSTRSDSTFMRDVEGSDKRFSFRFTSSHSEDRVLVVTECAIDLLSYLTLMKLDGYEWREINALSLAGVYFSKEREDTVRLPLALGQYLKDHPQTSRIILCLDNDAAGQAAAKRIIDTLANLDVKYQPPTTGKDLNDMLREKKGIASNVKTRGGNSR